MSEITPDEIIHDLYYRYMCHTGGELETIHASYGFKKMVRKWIDEMWPNLKSVCPSFASEWKWAHTPECHETICGVRVKYDIKSQEVIVIAKA